MASDKTQADDIRKFEEIGTHPAANHNAISEALVFNENLGVARKTARLRYMRDRWALRLAKHPTCKILHSPDPTQSAGIGFLSFAPGIDGAKMREVLYNKHGIITTFIGGEEYSGLRITPNVYNTLSEVDTFAAAIETELG
jgi:selenocysteine lyase/cysteine desulfurase